MISLLPKIMQDKSNLALEQCIFKAFDIDLKPYMIYLLDHVDIRLLKFLAYQFHILGDEGWNLAKTEQEKRDLLKIAFQVHKFKGTKRALLRVLEMLGFNGEINEWFEYEGRPHRFKIVITLTNKSPDTELYDLLEKYIEIFKNKRSTLENLEIRLYPTGEEYIFGRLITEQIYTTPPIERSKNV